MKGDPLNPLAEDTGGEEEDRLEEGEEGVQGDTEQAEGDGEDQEEGVEDQGHQCQGPGEDEEEYPQDQCHHGFT